MKSIRGRPDITRPPDEHNNDIPRQKPGVRFADEDSFVTVPKKKAKEREKRTRPSEQDRAEEREFDRMTPSIAEARQKMLSRSRSLVDDARIRVDMLEALAVAPPQNKAEYDQRDKILARSEKILDNLDAHILGLRISIGEAANNKENDKLVNLHAQLREATQAREALEGTCEIIETQLDDFEKAS